MKNKVKALLVLCCLLVGLVGVVPVSAGHRAESKTIVVSDNIKATVGEELLLARCYAYQNYDATEIYIYDDSGNLVLNADDSTCGVYDIPYTNCSFKVSGKTKVSVERVKTTGGDGYACYDFVLKAKKKGSFTAKLNIKLNSCTDTYVWKGTVTKAKKPVKEKLPKVKSNSDYTVLNTYSYVDSIDYKHIIYVVEGKKTTDVSLRVTIEDKKGNILDTRSDDISLTKGKKNYFHIITDSRNISPDSKYTVKQKSSSSFWSGADNSIEVVKYNHNDDDFFITVKQVKEDMGQYARIKVLFFYNGALVDSEEGYYSVYAEDLDHKGDTDVIKFWIYGTKYTDVEFFLEDR